MIFFQVAYTFDAGPNACLYLEEQYVAPVVGILLHFYPNDVSNEKNGNQYIQGLDVIHEQPSQVRSFLKS